MTSARQYAPTLQNHMPTGARRPAGVNHQQGETMNQANQAPASSAARAVDLTKTYGKGEVVVRALDGVNLEFPRGCFTAVMGPSGSGKSTLIALSGRAGRADVGPHLRG